MPDGALYPPSSRAIESEPDPPGAAPSPRSTEPRRSLPLGAIVHHIQQNLSRRITVNELAGIARLSVFQLSRAFRREHETTPYRLVLEIRIDHATSLLSAGATIAETALHAGFADQSHFTRHFKRLTGMTPKQYAARRRLRAMPGTGPRSRFRIEPATPVIDDA